MERWTPNKLILESKFPEGSEDVHFKKTQEGAVIVKAHAFVLAQVSEVFAQQIYPLSEGQSLPILFTTWTRVTSNEKALEAFVLILYGRDPASFDLEILFGISSLAQYYLVSGLYSDLIRLIKDRHIPLNEIAHNLTSAWNLKMNNEQEQSHAVSSSIEATIRSDLPKINQILAAPFDLSPLKKQLSRSLPDGTDIESLLDAYRKFLALKV